MVVKTLKNFTTIFQAVSQSSGFC